MITISILISFLLVYIFLFAPVILLVCGKFFKVHDISFKNAFITNIVLLFVCILFVTFSFIFKIDNILINFLFWTVNLIIFVLIVRKRFNTTILKTIGIYFTSLVFSIIFSFALALLIRTFVVQAFKFPSSSNAKHHSNRRSCTG